MWKILQINLLYNKILLKNRILRIRVKLHVESNVTCFHSLLKSITLFFYWLRKRTIKKTRHKTKKTTKSGHFFCIHVGRNPMMFDYIEWKWKQKTLNRVTIRYNEKHGWYILHINYEISIRTVFVIVNQHVGYFIEKNMRNSSERWIINDQQIFRLVCNKKLYIELRQNPTKTYL
jgi:hypothetical protein